MASAAGHFEVIAGGINNYTVPPFRVARLFGANGHAPFGALEFAVFFFLDISVHVFYHEVLVKFFPFRSHSVCLVD